MKRKKVAEVNTKRFSEHAKEDMQPPRSAPVAAAVTVPNMSSTVAVSNKMPQTAEQQMEKVKEETPSSATPMCQPSLQQKPSEVTVKVEKDPILNSHVHSGAAPLLTSIPAPPTSVGGSILDQLLPAKQNGNLSCEIDDKSGVKRMGGWDSLARKSQQTCGLNMNAQFEQFRKQAHEKEEKRKMLKVDEERRRRLKEQEEKERAKEQIGHEGGDLEQDQELLRQREQERRRREAMHTGDVTKQMDLMLNFEANF
ncbi:hypothetical protein AB6A40_009053 [Gnathostoma spinigerum]|uniref:Bromodomain protein 4 C-terminal domain-containing protein n=1 Tax=Gnathostoma spinigerum TaxID=75299 RepID=A0ABD6EVY1_9BILA